MPSLDEIDKCPKEEELIKNEIDFNSSLLYWIEHDFKVLKYKNLYDFIEKVCSYYDFFRKRTRARLPRIGIRDDGAITNRIPNYLQQRKRLWSIRRHFTSIES